MRPPGSGTGGQRSIPDKSKGSPPLGSHRTKSSPTAALGDADANGSADPGSTPGTSKSVWETERSWSSMVVAKKGLEEPQLVPVRRFGFLLARFGVALRIHLLVLLEQFRRILLEPIQEVLSHASKVELDGVP